VQKKKKQAITAERKWRFSQFLSDSVLFSALLCAKSALLCKGGDWSWLGMPNYKGKARSSSHYISKVDGGGKPRFFPSGGRFFFQWA
jgi:hypothetical protein